MMDWKILYAQHAEDDLLEILDYITLSLFEPVIAQDQVDRIMIAVSKLREFPERYRVYDKEPWRSRGLRVLTVDNYVALYIPIKGTKTVTVIRVIYAGRDIDEQLEHTRIIE